MPANVERLTYAIYVRITPPLPPLEDVLLEIAQKTVPGTHSLYLPVEIPGGGEAERDYVEALWKGVTDTGMVALPDPRRQEPAPDDVQGDPG